MALASGTKLGQYQILAPLGAGGMGEVYRARDPQLGRDVAIKVLPSALSRDPDRLRRFEQEARAAAALNHPNILAVYQMGTHDGSPYLVSELLEGSTLRDLLLRGPVPARKAIDYAMQTAHGLAAAHEKGIVHRDLKPENVFVTKDGRVKILDFGLAKLIDQPHASDPGSPTLTGGTEPGVVLGTAGYMSPEQVRGETTDNRTDLFALGAILYELLTGKRAFHKPTSAETMAAILNEEPPSASQIAPATPPALQKVVQRCLEKNPAQRFHSASDLAFALEALSDAGTSPTSAFVARERRKSYWWIAAAAAVVLVVIAIAVWLARPPAVPVIESVVQLTNDGQVKAGSIEADSSRIYFNEGPAGSFRIAQVSITGGQTGEIQTNLLNPQITGITGDGSSMLVLSGASVASSYSMWMVPLPVGEPRRVGPPVRDANLFPDGRLLYRDNSGLYSANPDGSNPRKVALSDYDGVPGISSDGKKFTFHQYRDSDSWVAYEAASDGTGLRSIFKSGAGLPTAFCCTRWTHDGKYRVFRGTSDGNRWDLWAYPDRWQFFRSQPLPVRLTNGPLSYTSFATSRTGDQIFAVGVLRRGELQLYDMKTHRFLPFLGGISAVDPTFSRDGQWMTYQAYPEHTLWRCRVDGSERLQLTYAPMLIDFARISPDGTQVAFSDHEGRTYVTSMQGGAPRKLADHASAPDWSPDGSLLAVVSFEDNVFVSKVIDVRTGSVSTVPESKRTLGPWFDSQDSIIVTADDQSKIVRYNFKTRQWSDLVSSPDKFVNWAMTPDMKYFVYSTGGNNPTAYRLRVSNGVVESIGSLKNLHSVDEVESGPSLSASADDSILVTRDIGTQEVYALTVKWP